MQKNDITLTPHFTLAELTRTDNENLRDENYRAGRALLYKMVQLAHFAEGVRKIINCPMIITSGYRCAALTTAVGGSKTSQHLRCEAVDFIPSKISAKAAFDLIRNSPLEYGQLILEKRGQGHILHISMGKKRQNLYSPAAGKYQAWKDETVA